MTRGQAPALPPGTDLSAVLLEEGADVGVLDAAPAQMHVIQPPAGRRDDRGVLDAQRTTFPAALAPQALAAIRGERILSLTADRATLRNAHAEALVHAAKRTSGRGQRRRAGAGCRAGGASHGSRA